MWNRESSPRTKFVVLDSESLVPDCEFYPLDEILQSHTHASEGFY